MSELMIPFLRNGVPPVNQLNEIYSPTESSISCLNIINLEINDVIKRNEFRILSLVAPRGFGKSFLMKFKNEQNIINSNSISVYSSEFPSSPVDFLKKFVNLLGKNFFLSILKEIKNQNAISNQKDLYLFLNQISQHMELSIALISLENKEFSDISWKYLTSNLGFREINKIIFENMRISKNIKDEDSVNFLIGLWKIIKRVYNKGICYFIDEVDDLLNYSRKSKREMKKFLVKLINQVPNLGVFICLGCTDAVWRELHDDPFSESCGLSRRLRCTNIPGITIDEAILISDKIIEIYLKEYELDSEIPFDREKVIELYEACSRNLGNYISSLISFLDEFRQTQQFPHKKKDILSESRNLITELISTGKKNSDVNLRDMDLILSHFLSKLKIKFNNPPRVKSVRTNKICSIKSIITYEKNKIGVQSLLVKTDNIKSIGVNIVDPLVSLLAQNLINSALILVFLFKENLSSLKLSYAAEKELIANNLQDKIEIKYIDKNSILILIGLYHKSSTLYDLEKIASIIDENYLNILEKLKQINLKSLDFDQSIQYLEDEELSKISDPLRKVAPITYNKIDSALVNLKTITDPAQIGVSVREGIKTFIETISPLKDKSKSLKEQLESYLNNKLIEISDKELRQTRKLTILRHFEFLMHPILSVHKGSSKTIHNNKTSLEDAKYFLYLAILLIRRLLELER